MNIYQKNCLVILSLILGFVLSIAYGYSFRNFIDQPSFSAKDLEYKMMTEGIKTERYSISKLFKNDYSVNLSRPYYFPQHKVIVFNSYRDKSEQSFYKIDSQGNLVDSITFSQDYSTIIFGDYILQNKAYSSWIIDGDTTKKNYIEVNAGTNWSEDKVENEFDRLKRSAEDVFYFKYESLWDYDDPRNESKIDKAVFLINGIWYALYGKNLYVDLNDLPDHILPNLIPDDSSFDQPNSIAYVADFQKTNRVKENEWNGLAYINLLYKTDTIKIKAKLTQNEKPINNLGKYAAYNMGYFKPDGLPYAFIVQDDNYYIIKTKKQL